jgi:2'-5' RNA ligase
VVALWQNYQDSPELSELGAITKETVKDWKGILLAFREKTEKKYGASLSSDGSGNWAKDVSKKIAWVTKKEEVLELRRKLQTAINMIMMLVLAAEG